MKPRYLAAALAVALPHLADADGHKLLVMQSEGRADAGLRAKIDASITRLAAAANPQASAGELTFSDAATAVGCKPDAPGCKDEVLGMLAVDEIVITTVNPKPGGVEISARLVGKGGASRNASMVLAAGASPDKLDGIAPLFGGTVILGPAPAPAPPAPAAPAITSSQPTGAEPPGGPPPTLATPPPSPVPETAPDRVVAQPTDPPSSPHHRLEIAGMAGGATLAVLGLVFWGAASGVQGDIDNAPVKTSQDLSHLRDLESKGDAYAAVGNVMFVGGVVAAGVATYFYIRDRRTSSTTSSTTSVRLVPAVFDHGAGVALTFGGTP